MAITEKRRGPAVVLTPDSDITWRTQPELKDALDELSARGEKHIIIDLTNVREISGYGLGLLASRCGRLRREHGDIRLTNTSEPVRKLLHVTNLYEMFSEFEAADTAVQSFTIINRGHDQNDEEV